MVFYHFQDLIYRDENTVECCRIKKELYNDVYKLYIDYLTEIEKIKQMLWQRFGIKKYIEVHPAKEAAQKDIRFENKFKKIIKRKVKHNIEILFFKVKYFLSESNYMILTINCNELKG